MKKVILSIFVLLIAVSMTNAAMANSGDPGYKVGDTAMDFSLKGVDGKYYSLSNFTDVNGYVIIFTCNTCPVSQAYEDRIISLAERAKQEGFALLAINPNDPEIQPGDSYENMKKKAAAKSFNFPYLVDEGQKVYPIYGAKLTPHVFVLSKDKRVEYIGAIDDNSRNASLVKKEYVVNAMQMIKQGKTPDPSLTKAIGCGIKAKG